MSEWQPIETAPRDGTIIYACDAVRGYDSKVAFLKTSGEWVCIDFNQSTMNIGFYPTHWYPLINLPAPPVEPDRNKP